MTEFQKTRMVVILGVTIILNFTVGLEAGIAFFITCCVAVGFWEVLTWFVGHDPRASKHEDYTGIPECDRIDDADWRTVDPTGPDDSNEYLDRYIEFKRRKGIGK